MIQINVCFLAQESVQTTSTGFSLCGGAAALLRVPPEWKNLCTPGAAPLITAPNRDKSSLSTGSHAPSPSFSLLLFQHSGFQVVNTRCSNVQFVRSGLCSHYSPLSLFVRAARSVSPLGMKQTKWRHQGG